MDTYLHVCNAFVFAFSALTFVHRIVAIAVEVVESVAHIFDLVVPVEIADPQYVVVVAGTV